jgi:hypothetical protein
VSSEITGLSTLGALARDSIEVSVDELVYRRRLTAAVLGDGRQAEGAGAGDMGGGVAGISGGNSSRVRKCTYVW